MKYILSVIIFCLAFISNPITSFGQNWKLQSEDGMLTVKAFGNSGKVIDVVAVMEEGDNCFMNVKGIDGDEKIAVKLVASDSVYIPVFAITANGTKMSIKAVNGQGRQYDVKGISRFGNTIRIAAVVGGSFHDIIALSEMGDKRQVAGVKFKDDNVEMEIGSVRIVAHVKALPTIEVKTEETVWDIKAMGSDGTSLDVIALNKKGKEYSVKAYSEGGSFALLNVKSDTGQDMINIKLTKNDEGILVTAIDYYGRKFPLKVKTADGKYLDVVGGKINGRSIDIRAYSPEGTEYTINAISPEGDKYDVRGLKIIDNEKEGYIQGHEGLVFFFAHVKAIPPIR